MYLVTCMCTTLNYYVNDLNKGYVLFIEYLKAGMQCSPHLSYPRVTLNTLWNPTDGFTLILVGFLIAPFSSNEVVFSIDIQAFIKQLVNKYKNVQMKNYWRDICYKWTGLMCICGFCKRFPGCQCQMHWLIIVGKVKPCQKLPWDSVYSVRCFFLLAGL